MTPKWIEQKRHYREFRARIERLPEPYRESVIALERYINHLGGVDDSTSLLQLSDDLADLFERAAADGIPVRDVFGDDPVAFAEDFLANYPAGRWITRERDRLTAAVARAAGES